ncbi:hypothetical protein QVD17_37475 [Tagetes erecta]|uniref:Uncharacterized protein n=1 Tax=Tagetes erecta TaxID=13708 RepID=A0AAD8JW32_TARER|nr:hypothetical protein QVD17_37475 [Tagetes erecta]
MLELIKVLSGRGGFLAAEAEMVTGFDGREGKIRVFRDQGKGKPSMLAPMAFILVVIVEHSCYHHQFDNNNNNIFFLFQ